MRWAIIVLLLSTVVIAQDIVSEGKVSLLAMTQNGSDKFGSIAELSLEIRPGSERVFLETFPMTKVTTQASLRFAQQIACKQLDVDCSEYDFLFTIRALPGIVGGPSAGAAATLLTSSLLLNKTIPSDVAITGTINSGGTIGPVGGLKKKVEAAGRNGIELVLLPKGTTEVEENNETVDLKEYGRSLNLTVREVATISEVLFLALDVPMPSNNISVEVDPEYERLMRAVAEDLCSRAERYAADPLEGNMSEVANFTRRSKRAMQDESFYAAASFCFRANVEYKKQWYQEQNFSIEEIGVRAEQLRDEARTVKKATQGENVSSVTGLQTFMAVMERAEEAEELAKDALKAKNASKAATNLGYAEERLFSAKTWSRFFGLNGRQIVVDEESLQESCAAKIAEAEERYNYVKSIIPEALSTTKEDIEKAYRKLRDKEYIMCLYGASKAKAEADVLLNLIGVKESRFDEVITLKLGIAQKALVKEQQKQVFPIIAYSYYEYAKSLREFDRVSALLFAEYALELAHVDLYFEEVKKARVPEDAIKPWMIEAIVSVGVLALIWALIMSYRDRPSSRKRSKPKQAPKRLRGKKR